MNGSIYRPWAEIRCRAYCGFCIVPTTQGPCVDKINNCIEYNDDLCTNPLFRLFREDNCQKFCGLCTPGGSQTPTTQMAIPSTQAPPVTTQAPQTTQAPPTTTQAPPATTQAPPATTQAPPATTQAPATTMAPATTGTTIRTPPPLIPKSTIIDTTESSTTQLPNTPPQLSTTVSNLNTSEDCDNKDSDCDYYNDESCVGIYESWARDHCALRCGYCENKTEPCVDLINYCDKFEANMCTDINYSGFARTNCRAFCNLCGVPVHNTNSTTSNNTATPSPIRVTTQKTQQVTSGNGTNIASSYKNSFIIDGPPSNKPGNCLYKNNYIPENTLYKDGCDYNCECLDAVVNKVECTDLCPHWQNYSSDCKLTGSPGKCCQDLVCGGSALIPTTVAPPVV